ncbi:hypothetical protein N0V90_003030 [Kalmusia sp. IMI 367209]|nr:hypothetical protein N0V90_003030 [Kalmusia sp. IMI 367209]
MFTQRIVLAGFIAAASASLIAEDHFYATLLKRQDPGTPEYNCHDNCGTAITVSKAGGDYCTNEVFLYDYKNCLQCAGPDNVDIWKYYGGTLTSNAGKCGLDTEPLSGKQADVGEAKHPGDSAGTSSAASSSSVPTSTADAVSEPPASSAEASSTPEPTTPAEPTSSAGVVTDASSSSAPEATATDAVSEVESSAAASLSSVVASAVSSAVSSAYETGAGATAVPLPTVSGSPYPTGNGTSNGTAPTASAPLTAPTNAAGSAQLHNVVALLGAVAMGAAFY